MKNRLLTLLLFSVYLISQPVSSTAKETKHESGFVQGTADAYDVSQIFDLSIAPLVTPIVYEDQISIRPEYMSLQHFVKQKTGVVQNKSLTVLKTNRLKNSK